VPRQNERYALDLSVQLYTSHQWRRAMMQDISQSGMFIATSPLLVGTPVVVALDINGTRIACPAQVTHALGGDDARALCRQPGVGLAFRDPIEPAFAAAIDGLVRRARGSHIEESHIVVADAEPRVLERLSTALGGAGFSVATASNALEVLGACLRRVPDVVLVDRAIPMLDGLQLIERIVCDERLSSVPIVMMTRDPGELELAFSRGVGDVILKPFAMVELIARTRRIAQMPKRDERVLLSGSIGELGLAAVLTMIELEKKTVRLVASNGHAAWIDLVGGRVVDAGWSLDGSHPRAVVLSLLDWKQGTFKLVASPPRRRETQLAMPITQLLLEQARLHDEAARVS
jgi:CheY-like chemotaxis protein